MSERLTTASGLPVVDNQNSLAAGARGPLLLQDVHLIEKLQHFNRERIPERVVHAKGSGAYGRFTVTHDFSQFTKARRFAAVGKTTETFVRFSTVIAGAMRSVSAEVKRRQIGHFTKADPAYGAAVARKLAALGALDPEAATAAAAKT